MLDAGQPAITSQAKTLKRELNTEPLHHPIGLSRLVWAKAIRRFAGARVRAGDWSVLPGHVLNLKYRGGLALRGRAIVDIGAWLRGLGLEQYARAFADNDIEAQTLRDLNGDDLKDIGVVSVGHRKRLLAAIAELSDEGPERAPPTPATASGERRQVTILFADLAGFTELSSALDAEELHAVVSRFFEAVDRVVAHYGGTVDKPRRLFRRIYT